MDDDALRSMLPMSFGGGGGGGGGAKKPQPGPREPHTQTGRVTEEEEEEEANANANEIFVGPPEPADNDHENDHENDDDFCGPVLPPGYEDINAGTGTDDQPTTATFSSEHRVPVRVAGRHDERGLASCSLPPYAHSPNTHPPTHILLLLLLLPCSVPRKLRWNSTPRRSPPWISIRRALVC